MYYFCAECSNVKVFILNIWESTMNLAQWYHTENISSCLMDIGSTPWFDMEKFNTNLHLLYTYQYKKWWINIFFGSEQYLKKWWINNFFGSEQYLKNLSCWGLESVRKQFSISEWLALTDQHPRHRMNQWMENSQQWPWTHHGR